MQKPCRVQHACNVQPTVNSSSFHKHTCLKVPITLNKCNQCSPSRFTPPNASKMRCSDEDTSAANALHMLPCCGSQPRMQETYHPCFTTTMIAAHIGPIPNKYAAVQSSQQLRAYQGSIQGRTHLVTYMACLGDDGGLLTARELGKL